MIEYKSKQYYTVNEFAKLINLTPFSVRRHIKNGVICAEKIKTKGLTQTWIIPQTELQKFRNE